MVVIVLEPEQGARISPLISEGTDIQRNEQWECTGVGKAGGGEPAGWK